MKIFLILSLMGYVSCGPIKKTRIVGGSITTIRNYPYMASLLLKSELLAESELFAGGTIIIGRYWTITAAHCVFDFMDSFVPTGHIFVRSNTTIWNGADGYPSDHLVLRAYVHDLYNNFTNDYDAALLKVQQKFSGVYEIPIPLARADYQYEVGSTAVVLGWGTTKPDVDPFTVPELRAVEVNLIDHGFCEEQYRRANEDLTPRMLCAGAPGRDACVDDSGGPLIQGRTLIGIVSWGIECANMEHPGVYTNISEITEWLKRYEQIYK